MANWEKGGTGQCGMGRGSSPSTSATSIVISSQPLKPSLASPSHHHFQYQFYVERCSTSLYFSVLWMFNYSSWATN